MGIGLMDEATWLHSLEPDELLAILEARANSRKLRLFCCACARRIWYRLSNNNMSCRAIELAERFADDQATQLDLSSASLEAENVVETSLTHAEKNARRIAAWSASEFMDALGIARSVAWGSVYASMETEQTERAAQAQLLRDIFSNPFQHYEIAPELRTSTVLTFAQQMYESRDFGAMPILADALEDAGCDTAEILTHCRNSGPHVRGCWVVDLILGKQ